MDNNGTISLFNGFTLDLARGCVVREGELIHLRPQTYEVLRYLVENSGHLISKDKLIEEVWKGRAVTDGSLGKCIEELRNALGVEAREYIRNVRGRGYIFDAGIQEEEKTVALSARTENFDVIRVTVEDHEEITDSSAPKALAPAIAAPRSISKLKIAAIAAAGVLVVITAMFVGSRFLNSAPNPAPIKSIAVLPFKNESGNPDAEYLADGMTESLINSLSQLPNLSVKARSTVFRHKDSDATLQQIASELSVQAVLTGRVVQRGDELILYLSLVDARSGNQLWGGQYNRKLTDLLALQKEIAREVSSKLRGRLSGGDEQRVMKGYTANTEAFRLYLNGRYHYFKLTEAEIRKSIGLFQQALDADPAYARAYAGMADSYRTLPIASYVPSREAFPQAKAAARRALEIDDDLADAHIVLGWVGFWFDWDMTAAENQFRRAIELSPDNADAHRGYAHLLSNLGRHEEAIATIEKARALDALTLVTQALEAQFLFYAGRDGEAIARSQKLLETDSTFWIAHNVLGRIYTRQGRYDEAIAAFIKARALSSGSPEAITQLGYALAKSGKREQAQATLKELRSIAAEKYVPAYCFAMIYNGLGEKEEALKHLEKSFQEREVQVTFIKIDTRWDAFRAEPRFQTMLRGIGF